MSWKSYGVFAGLILAHAIAGCGLRAAPLTIPERDLAAKPPQRMPTVRAIAPQLVAYPGLEVSYVANADGEIYHYRGVFYTYFDNHWFYAQQLRGPWTFIEMKYVPSDLFRVRGHRPPGLEEG